MQAFHFSIKGMERLFVVLLSISARNVNNDFLIITIVNKGAPHEYSSRHH